MSLSLKGPFFVVVFNENPFQPFMEASLQVGFVCFCQAFQIYLVWGSFLGGGGVVGVNF